MPDTEKLATFKEIDTFELKVEAGASLENLTKGYIHDQRILCGKFSDISVVVQSGNLSITIVKFDKKFILPEEARASIMANGGYFCPINVYHLFAIVKKYPEKEWRGPLVAVGCEWNAYDKDPLPCTPYAQTLTEGNVFSLRYSLEKFGPNSYFGAIRAQ